MGSEQADSSEPLPEGGLIPRVMDTADQAYQEVRESDNGNLEA
jgi:hypothetical protein